MRSLVHQARRHGSALAAFVLTLAFVAEVHGYPPPRRGRMSTPQPPANIDSSPMIDGLNKALKALNATDRDYGGHREKAINHIHAAIRDLEVPNAKGQSAAKASATDKASADNSDADKTAAKTPTTSQADSDASLSKAREALFSIYHKLEDKASTRGRIHARAEVYIAIDELAQAKKSVAAVAAPVAAPAAAPASASASAPARAAAKPAK